MATEEPKIQEVDSDDEVPELVEGGANPPEAPEAGAGYGRQNRAEKKMRKALSKMGLKPYPGVKKMVVKKTGGGIMFFVNAPEVQRHPTSDIFVVFGQPEVDNGESAAQIAQQEAMAKAMMAQMNQQQAAAGAAGAEGAAEGADEEEGDVDLGDLKESDVALVMEQGRCSKAKAIKVLKQNNGDVVNSIMELTM